MKFILSTLWIVSITLTPLTPLLASSDTNASEVDPYGTEIDFETEESQDQSYDRLKLLPDEIIQYICQYLGSDSLTMFSRTDTKTRDILSDLIEENNFNLKFQNIDPSITHILSNHPKLKIGILQDIYNAGSIELANFLEAVVDTQVLLIKLNSIILGIYETHSDYLWGLFDPSGKICHMTVSPLTFLIQDDFKATNTYSNLTHKQTRHMCLNQTRRENGLRHYGSNQPDRGDFYRKTLITTIGETPQSFAKDQNIYHLPRGTWVSAYVLNYFESLMNLAQSSDLAELSPIGDYQLKRRLLSGAYQIDTSRLISIYSDSHDLVEHVSNIEFKLHTLLKQLEYARITAIRLLPPVN